MRTIAEQTLYTCGCGANEFNFRCGFALCGAKKNICDSQHCCSTPAPKSSAAKQWIKELTQTKEEEESYDLFLLNKTVQALRH